MKKALLILVLLLGSLVRPHQAVAAQAACSAGCTNWNTALAFGTNPLTITITSVGAGDAIRGQVCYFPPSAIPTVTVNGVTAPLTTPPAFDGTNTSCVSYGVPNVSAGTATIIATYATTPTLDSVTGEDWPGDSTTSLLDNFNGTYTFGGAGGVNLPCGSFTTSNANDTIEVWLFQPQNTIPTLPSGYAFATNSGGTATFYSAFKVVSSAGAQNPIWVSGVGSNDNYVTCAGFEKASAPVNGTFNQLMLHASLADFLSLRGHS